MYHKERWEARKGGKKNENAPAKIFADATRVLQPAKAVEHDNAP